MGESYDPLIGSFLSPDNYVQDPGDSQNYNRYAYSLNNPLKYIDPSGYFSWSNFWHGVEATIVGIGVTVAVTAATIASCGAATPEAVAEGAALLGAMVGGFAGGATGAALNGGDFIDCMGAGMKGMGMAAATFGVTNAIGYGLNNTWIGPEGISFRNNLTNEPLSNYLPSVDPLIKGVSNTALISSFTGGVLSTSVFPKPIINPVYESSYLQFTGQLTDYPGAPCQYVNGFIDWIDVYSDGTELQSISWKAVSGPWNAPPSYKGRVDVGSFFLSGPIDANLLTNPGYTRDGVTFAFRIYDDVLVHADGGVFGTQACIGLQDNANRLMLFYNKTSNYMSKYSTIKLVVSY